MDKKIKEGFMCWVEFDRLGVVEGQVFPTVADLEDSHHHVHQCGIVMVTVNLTQVVEYMEHPKV
jgi:hypothetical protein